MDYIKKNKDFEFTTLNYDGLDVFYHGKLLKNKETPHLVEDLNLSTEILDLLKLLNYNKLTPIQRTVFPYISEGKDVMGSSQTGKKN